MAQEAKMKAAFERAVQATVSTLRLRSIAAERILTTQDWALAGSATAQDDAQAYAAWQFANVILQPMALGRATAGLDRDVQLAGVYSVEADRAAQPTPSGTNWVIHLFTPQGQDEDPTVEHATAPLTAARHTIGALDTPQSASSRAVLLIAMTSFGKVVLLALVVAAAVEEKNAEQLRHHASGKEHGLELTLSGPAERSSEHLPFAVGLLMTLPEDANPWHHLRGGDPVCAVPPVGPLIVWRSARRLRESGVARI